MPTTRRPRVTILQRRLVNYRVRLFEDLRNRCDEEDIDFHIVYGQASPTDAKRNDGASLPWAEEVDARWFDLGGTEVVWQPCSRWARTSDLVIMTQESKILSNYPFLAARPFVNRKIAYWGHGRNLQSENARGLRERWKELLTTKVDWWFAYTEHTRDILVAAGFPEDHVTCLDNAIDNEAFEADLAAVTEPMLEELRAGIDLAPGGLLGFYCGALYDDKRVDLLMAVGSQLHAADPTFRLVVIGDGPARPELEALMAAQPWAYWLGVKTGVEKAAWFRLADAIISPGAVGLHVLDAFTAGVPMFTTASAKHGPEIDYLEHGRNGFVLDDDPERFATELLAVVRDADRLSEVIEAGRKAAARYTLANMTDNFVNGIIECLAD